MLPSDASVPEIAHVLQAAISPIAVISGVGLLLLSMTNRYGRIIDRIRVLLSTIAAQQDGVDKHLNYHEAKEKLPELIQLHILYKRARILRTCIVLATVSIFMVALTIAFLYCELLFNINFWAAIYTSFLLSILAIIISLGFFIWDISVSLTAIKNKIYRQIPGDWLEQPVKVSLHRGLE